MRIPLLVLLTSACGTVTSVSTDAPTATVDARAAVDASTATVDAPPPGSGPSLGARAITFHFADGDVAPISTPPMATQASGSTIIVGVGRGALPAHVPPTDNKGNSPYRQLGNAQAYTLWPTSGTALYAFTGAAGGAGHVITADTTTYDEITLAAVEVMNGRTVRDFTWVERLKGTAITARPVTTTGPAVLVAFWWGDADAANDKTATPNNGFQVVGSVLSQGSLVQCAVAVKTVAAAGTYDVTWTATPAQGAQLWLVAVE